VTTIENPNAAQLQTTPVAVRVINFTKKAPVDSNYCRHPTAKKCIIVPDHCLGEIQRCTSIRNLVASEAEIADKSLWETAV
jgi:hypothetical protein